MQVDPHAVGVQGRVAEGVQVEVEDAQAGALESLKYVLVGFSAALRAISTAVLTVTLSLSYAALAKPSTFHE